MVGPCGPATRVDMGRRARSCDLGLRGGWGAPSTFARRRTWHGSGAPIAESRIDKRERRNRRGIGPHHAGTERDRQDKGLSQEERPLLLLEPALRPDQHGERTPGFPFERG